MLSNIHQHFLIAVPIHYGNLGQCPEVNLQGVFLYIIYCGNDYKKSTLVLVNCLISSPVCPLSLAKLSAQSHCHLKSWGFLTMHCNTCIAVILDFAKKAFTMTLDVSSTFYATVALDSQHKFYISYDLYFI